MLVSRFPHLGDDLIRAIVSLRPNLVGCLPASARVGRGEFSGFADRTNQAYRAVTANLALGDQHRDSQIDGFGDLASVGSCFRLCAHARPFITQEKKNIKTNLWVETKKAAGPGEASGWKVDQATGLRYRRGHPRSV